MGIFSKKSREEKFWAWFKSNASSVWNLNDDHSIVPSLVKALNKYNPNLSWLMSPVLENGEREFIISADGISRYFPIARRLVDQAPSIENWKFVALKPAIGLLEFAEFEGLKVFTEDILFTYDKEQKYNLILYIKDYDKSDKRFIGCMFILLDSLLGEVSVATFIGHLHFEKAEDGQSNDGKIKLEELKDILHDHVNWQSYFR